MNYGIEDMIRFVCSCHQWEVIFIRCMFVVAKAMRPQSWKATKRVLEWQRDHLLNVVNPDWKTT